jgi:spore coat protein U-like protein
MTGIRWSLSLAVLSAVLLYGARSQAQPFGGCQISATPVSFGGYNVYDTTAVASTGSVTYACGLLYFGYPTVWLNKGSAASNNPRQMVNGSSRLDYNLYVDAGHTKIWGDPSPNQVTGGLCLNLGCGATWTVYGLIPASQDVPVGTYADTVTATVNF